MIGGRHYYPVLWQHDITATPDNRVMDYDNMVKQLAWNGCPHDARGKFVANLKKFLAEYPPVGLFLLVDHEGNIGTMARHPDIEINIQAQELH